MKGLSLFVLMLVLLSAVAGAEISLSGEANAYLNVFPSFPYTSSRFDSPLNPDNISGFQDLNFDTDVTFRLDAGQTAGQAAGAFTLWLAVNPYQMSQPLSVLRANIAWYIGQAFVLRMGRQSMLTGYGYGWNPMDFANTVKDPFDPDAELRGVDALSLQFYLGNLFALKLAGIFRIDSFLAGADYKDLQVGAELTASFPVLELKLSGYYDSDTAAGEDAFVPALGAGFMLDLSGVGIYGEGALLWGGRTPVPLAVSFSSPERKEELLASGLLGVEYTFVSELRLIAEYFYNGEGYSLQERKLYNERLKDNYSEHVANYRPGYLAKHYLLLNLGYPIYPWTTNVELSTYYSPDSGALGIMPSLELEVSGSLSVRAGYAGMFSLQENQYDEAWFSSFKHVVELRLNYFF